MIGARAMTERSPPVVLVIEDEPGDARLIELQLRAGEPRASRCIWPIRWRRRSA